MGRFSKQCLSKKTGSETLPETPSTLADEQKYQIKTI